MNIKGTMHHLRKRCKNAKLLILTKVKTQKVIKRYVYQPIALLELLWYCRYIDPTLLDKELPNDKKYHLITKDILQFKNEKSEIELTINKIRVEVDFVLKGHYMIARREIECA